MPRELPPRDPHESQWTPSDGVKVAAPTVVFAHAGASPAADRIADAILDVRPGLLIVLADV